jgi:LPS sulfotransferase NodH
MIDFVVISAPRTGSNHLCSMLNLEDMVMHFELFRVGEIDFQTGSGAHLEMMALSPEERDRDPIEFLQKVKAAEILPVVGFKLFPWQNDKLAETLIVDPSIRKVILHRENLLAMYASKRIAEQTNRYFSTDKGARDTVRCLFQAKGFEAMASEVTNWFSQARGLLEATGQAYFDLPYAQINDEQTIVSLVTYLTGAPPRLSSHDSPHVKTGSVDIVSRFENSEEVESYLRENGREDWRYEASS